MTTLATSSGSAASSAPDSLAQFLSAYRRARGVDAPTQQIDSPEQQIARLAALFSAIGEFRRSEARPIVLPPRQVDPDQISAFLAKLRDGIAACRHDGRLLNVWAISGLKRNEVRTSAVLGWVLDCNGSHGFGSEILDELILLLREREGSERFPHIKLGRHYSLSLEHCAFGEMDNRVDLAIEGENCVLFIEVKIDAGLGPNQLERYLETANAKARALKKEVVLVLFLSERPLGASQEKEIIWLRWTDVAKAISNVVSRSPEKTLSGALLQQFAAHIKSLH